MVIFCHDPDIVIDTHTNSLAGEPLLQSKLCKYTKTNKIKLRNQVN